MDNPQHTPTGQVLTELVLDIFRLNNRLIAAGDQLVAPIGLSSARWKVLGVITAASRPQPVAWLARDMGANRQNVQRIVNDLVAEGLLALEPNPHHRRAPLVVLTAAGRQAYAESMRLQVPWVNALSAGISEADMATTHRVVAALCTRLEGERDAAVSEPE